MSNNWPAGCHDRGSCERHKRCMYINCRHDGHDISDAVVRRPANDDMVQGYRDGYDPTAPEPSANRSASYRHGFMVGRGEKTGDLVGDFLTLCRAADAAMDADDIRALQ